MFYTNIFEKSVCIFGIRALTGHNFLISLRLFNMAANGTFFGFIGNIPGIAVTCLGFGVPAYFGFSKDIHSRKKGFIYGLVLTGICLLSLIVSVFTHHFTLGDLFITAVPAVYTFALPKTA